MRTGRSAQRNFGYMQAISSGQNPIFQEVKIPIKKVPVCKCGESNQTRTACGEGFLEQVMAGKDPHFK